MRDIEDHSVALLGEYDHGVRKGWHPDYFSWQLFHAFSFLLGGTTFIAGTVCLFFPGYDTLSAVLYSIGSAGFLSVDLQEFFSFDGTILRINISMSATGSLLYLIGSLGFLPQILATYPFIGIWGFILGSFFIGCSQLWKTARIASTETGHFKLSSIFSHTDAATATGVEFGACVGAWCFFFGTILFDQGPLEGPDSVLQTVLWTWIAGSVAFTIGGLFVAWRHFVMGVV